MQLQSLLGLSVVAVVLGLLFRAALSSDAARQRRIGAWTSGLLLGYGTVAFVLACVHWASHKDWVHLAWTSVHPQLVLFAGAGAFLLRDELRRRAGATRLGRGPWIVGAVLLALALLPAALIQWAPDPEAAPRNLGRPFAGTLEVARFGLGGPVPPSLVPEGRAGAERGLGFLPREVTVPVLTAAHGAVLWIALVLVQLTGALLRPPRLRRAYLALAPFVAVLLLAALPMPFGLRDDAVWRSEPLMLRAFGPLLLAAVLASLLVPLGQRLSRRPGSATAAPRPAPRASDRSVRRARCAFPRGAARSCP